MICREKKGKYSFFFKWLQKFCNFVNFNDCIIFSLCNHWIIQNCKTLEIIWKKTAKNTKKFHFFTYKSIFLWMKNEYFQVYNVVNSDRNEQNLSEETIRIWNFLFSQKLWWKDCWKMPTIYLLTIAEIATLPKSE